LGLGRLEVYAGFPLLATNVILLLLILIELDRALLRALTLVLVKGFQFFI